MKASLDEMDKRILDALLRSGRMSVSDLAESVGLSRPAVTERMEKLEKMGIIRGYTAVLSGYPVEKPVVAFIAARYRGRLSGRAEEAIEGLSRRKEILEVHGVAGEDCLYIKVRAEDMEDLHDLVQELKRPPLSMETRTTIVMNTYFEKVGGAVLPGSRSKKR